MKNTRFISCFIFLFLISCFNTHDHKRSAEDCLLEYKLITTFSRRIRPKTGLVLFAYGINNDLPTNMNLNGKTFNFRAAYYCFKSRDTSVSIDDARALAISVAEALREEIDRSEEIRPFLFSYPTPRERVNISLRFEDQEKMELRQGVVHLYFHKGTIFYRGHGIMKPKKRDPVNEEHYQTYQESYDEALEIVQKQGRLINM